jgi:two-component system sensor histidine kinase PilS (NtrC family)
MIINPLGRIRSFNAAAERISGYTLEDVYDRDVRDVFPSFAVYDGTLQIVDRGEGLFDASETGSRTFGYASSLVRGTDGKTLGLLITFKDMTWYKDLEERLKRSDRLAAVGQLASGMAHEIRNPLASISGSVQLLMEGRNVSEEDRRLMRIVIKEADRLSDLLTDFLLYAHPGPPKIAAVDVSAVLDELAVIAATDPRFAAVEIRRAYPPGVRMQIDRQQLHQALWNLVINGAEAMTDGGALTIGLGPGGREIFVEDTGPGIPESIRNRIFNPFFTTKERGTGLGLATVHAIVEAHGGAVSVAAGKLGGARFVIRLPDL